MPRKARLHRCARYCDRVAMKVGWRNQRAPRGAPSDEGRRPAVRSARRICVAALLVLAGATVTGCGGDDAATARSPTQLDVGTTVAPITSLAASIGGDRVKITGIVPEGTNSHTFEPKPSVAELLSGLDVLFVNGL